MGWLTVTLFLYALMVYSAGIYAFYVMYPASMAWHTTTGVAAMLVLASILVAQWSTRIAYGIAAVVIGLIMVFCVARFFIREEEALPSFAVLAVSIVMTCLLALAHFLETRKRTRPTDLDE